MSDPKMINPKMIDQEIPSQRNIKQTMKWIEQARVWTFHDDGEIAMKILDRVISLNGKMLMVLGNARLLRGEILLSQKRWDAACREFDFVINLKCKSHSEVKSAAYYYRAKTQFQLKNLECSLQDICSAIDLKFGAKAFLFRARVLIRLGEWYKAECDLKAALIDASSSIKDEATILLRLCNENKR